MVSPYLYLTALFPNLGYFAILPAVVGLIIGICKLSRDGYCPMAISGVVLNGVAIMFAMFWTAILSFATVDVLDSMFMQQSNSNPPIVAPAQVEKK